MSAKAITNDEYVIRTFSSYIRMYRWIIKVGMKKYQKRIKKEARLNMDTMQILVKK